MMHYDDHVLLTEWVGPESEITVSLYQRLIDTGLAFQSANVPLCVCAMFTLNDEIAKRAMELIAQGKCRTAA